MAAVPFKGLTELRMRRADHRRVFDLGGAFVITDRQAELVTLGRQPLRIRDLIRVLQTSSDLVEYVAQTSAPTTPPRRRSHGVWGRRREARVGAWPSWCAGAGA
jgi:hypothetical protein